MSLTQAKLSVVIINLDMRFEDILTIHHHVVYHPLVDVCLVTAKPEINPTNTDLITIIQVPNGNRAAQLNIGADFTTAPNLLFLHSDTSLPANFYDLVTNQLNRYDAGAFQIQFDVSDFWLSCWSKLSAINSRVTTFGDQALFMKRSVFEELEGFSQVDFMEDFLFVQQLYRNYTVGKLSVKATTRATRFIQNGTFYQQFINVLMVVLVYLGVHPNRLKKWYSNI